MTLHDTHDITNTVDDAASLSSINCASVLVHVPSLRIVASDTGQWFAVITVALEHFRNMCHQQEEQEVNPTH